MPTTTNNSWTTPADSDAFKDGALAMRTLGNGIDSTLGVVTNWTSYTPTTASITIGNGTMVARYYRIGKTVHYFAKFTLGSTSAIAADASISPPFTSAQDYVGSATYYDTSAAVYYNGFTKSNFLGYQGLYGYISNTVPMTWATGDVIRVSATYEMV
jgi:hypothetical protein